MVSCLELAAEAAASGGPRGDPVVIKERYGQFQDPDVLSRALTGGSRSSAG